MLTDIFVKNVTYKGSPTGEKHSDGGAMYLLVKAAGKYWRFDYRINGKRKTLALGVYPDVVLRKARIKRDEARQLLADGTDPGTAKKQAKLNIDVAAQNTFKKLGEEWLDKTATNRKAVTQERVAQLLKMDIYPFIGKIPISQLGPRDVLRPLKRIECRGAIDTAHRANQYCGQIFRYAVASGAAKRDVTVDLKGALKNIPKNHYAAITEPDEAAYLLRAIDCYKGFQTTVAALKLLPMVFVRPGELRMIEWVELDLRSAEWRVPGHRMKMSNDHIVPLSTQAVEILKGIHPLTGHGKYVFPSIRTSDRPMSENTINAALRAMGYPKEVMTGHGFRALARTVMDEILEERVDLIEHQLAHAVKDSNGRAYNRTSHLAARKKMMQRWSDYLDKLRTSSNNKISDEAFEGNAEEKSAVQPSN